MTTTVPAQPSPPNEASRMARPVRPSRPKRPRGVGPRPALVRDRECEVAGVSAGIARHLSAPVDAVRAVFVVMGLVGGAGVLLYVWCWAFMPLAPGDAAPTRRVPVAWILLAASAAGLGWVSVSLADPSFGSWYFAPESDLPWHVVVAVLATTATAVRIARLMPVLVTTSSIVIGRETPACC